MLHTRKLTWSLPTKQSVVTVISTKPVAQRNRSPEPHCTNRERMDPRGPQVLLWQGDPPPGLSVGSCLTFTNELSKETHMLMKRETLLGKVESRRMREPRTALPRGWQPQVFPGWGWFPGCLWPLILTQRPSWCYMHREGWIPTRILGGW